MTGEREGERTLLNAANEGHIHTLMFLLQKGVSADVYEVCEMRYLAHFCPLSFILLFSSVYVSLLLYLDTRTCVQQERMFMLRMCDHIVSYGLNVVETERVGKLVEKKHFLFSPHISFFVGECMLHILSMCWRTLRTNYQSFVYFHRSLKSHSRSLDLSMCLSLCLSFNRLLCFMGNFQGIKKW